MPLLYGITNALKRKRKEACSQEVGCRKEEAGEREEEEEDVGGVWRTIEETGKNYHCVEGKKCYSLCVVAVWLILMLSSSC